MRAELNKIDNAFQSGFAFAACCPRALGSRVLALRRSVLVVLIVIGTALVVLDFAGCNGNRPLGGLSKLKRCNLPGTDEQATHPSGAP